MMIIEQIVNNAIAEVVWDMVLNDCIDKYGCLHGNDGKYKMKDDMSNFTSEEEKQRKINSVNIDFYKDNILPPLNIEERNLLNLPNIPVRIKQNRLW